MSLVLTMDMIRQGNTCDPAIAEMEKYFIENNITEVSFDEIIAYWKKINRRDWAIWVYENKKVFEAISSYTPSVEEQVADEKILQDLNSFEHIGYIVNNVQYKTFEEASVARQTALSSLKEEMEQLVICNLEEQHENGDASWIVVDLDNLQINDSCVIKVFNPLTGQYTTHDTVEAALSKRNELIVAVSDVVNGTAVIGKVLQHKDFKEELIVSYDF